MIKIQFHTGEQLRTRYSCYSHKGKRWVMKINKIVVLITLFYLFQVSCKKDDTESIPVLMNNHFQILENTSKGAFAGAAYAFDKNTKENIYYKITEGNDNSAFSIDSLTGIIRVNNPLAIDFESHPVYNLTITATVKNNPEKSNTNYVTIYLRNMGMPLAGMVSYYSFNNLRDSITKASAISSKYIGFFTDRYNNPNEAVEFPGYLSYIVLDSAYDFPSRTISFWFNSYDIINEAFSILNLDNESLQNGSLSIYVKKADTISYLYINISNHTDSIKTNINIWNHLAIIQESTNFKIFYNDSLVKETNITPFTHGASGNPHLILGSDQTLKKAFFQGSIDDFLVYNRALNSEELHILNIEHNLQ